MNKQRRSIVVNFAVTAVVGAAALYLGSSSLPRALGQANSQQLPRPDVVAQAQQPSPVQNQRPEQNKSQHDTGGSFSAQQAEPSSPIFLTQPKGGKNSGIDYYRDPLNSDHPGQDPDEIMKALAAAKGRGVKLGGFRGQAATADDRACASAALTAKANGHAASLAPMALSRRHQLVGRW